MKKGVIDEGVWGPEEIVEKTIRPNQWGQVGARIFKAFTVTHKKIPSGYYTVSQDNRDNSVLIVGKYVKVDDVMRFKDDLAAKFLKEIEDFWNKEQLFKKNGFLHKRGYLLYGKQGTGKSSIAWMVAQSIIEKGGVVFVCDNPKFLVDGLKIFRQVEPERPIACIFEDIDAIIRKYGDSDLLSLLDGASQVDRIINLATTNYPESLDRRIISRPRRFDRIYKIMPPDDSIREAYFTKKLPKGENPGKWVKLTRGLSFASLAEVLISVLCLGNDLNETVKILKDIENNKLSSSEFGTRAGFSKNDFGEGEGEESRKKDVLDDILASGSDN